MWSLKIFIQATVYKLSRLLYIFRKTHTCPHATTIKEEFMNLNENKEVVSGRDEREGGHGIILS